MIALVNAIVIISVLKLVIVDKLKIVKNVILYIYKGTVVQFNSLFVQVSK